MNKGKYVFAQLMSLIDSKDFAKCVARYQGNYRVRSFTCWHQFLCMSFGQLTYRDSLRDIVLCLASQQKKLYHLGISQGVKKSTLADANESRDWRIYADFAQILIRKARKLYEHSSHTAIELAHVVYALDSTTIELCLNVFWWAKFRKHKAAIKLHTLLDVKCQYLTNNFEAEALQLAILYLNRWKVEIFFKWIKQNLKIKSFWGESPNAVKTQIWIAYAPLCW